LIKKPRLATSWKKFKNKDATPNPAETESLISELQRLSAVVDETSPQSAH